MPLSLTTRRHLQTSSTRWSSQQHLSVHETLQRQQHFAQPAVRKQRSFIEPTSKLITSYSNTSTTTTTIGRSNLTRGLSAGRSQDIQRLHTRHLLKKHPSITGHNNSSNGHKLDGTTAKSSKSDDLIKRNITTCGKADRPSRSVQAWSSTSSILKSLDKELAQLNGVLGKTKDTRNGSGVVKDNSGNCSVKSTTNKTKIDSGPSTATTNTAANSQDNNSSHRYSFASTNSTTSKITPEVNKVNLSIVLSHALNENKDNEYILSEAGEAEEGESDDSTTDSEQLRHCLNKSLATDCKKPIDAQQRRVLYQSSKLASNKTINSSNSTASTITSGLQNPQNFHVSPSLTIQRRPPLQRAMSAPVRTFDDNSKGSFLAQKRKSRRRKLNTRTITCDRDSSPPDQLSNVKDLNLDAKEGSNKKILQRSRSVAADVITLVSLISSEGSDSEKEEFSSTPTNSDCNNSPTRRAPTLRKAGKSVSFQENYPPTFQFASKEYSHMLRRGSIAPLAARIKSNRPPTAPPVSIFHTANNTNNKSISSPNTTNNSSKTPRGMTEADARSVPASDNKNDRISGTTAAVNATTTISLKKPVDEETYKYPDYVRSLKERECWKLFQKMSAKGVNITYDTILRGMLTPTEFRQLQKQREAEEAKAQKEREELAAALLEQQQQKSKKPIAVIERLPSENSLND